MNIASIDIGSNSVILLIAEINQAQKRFVPVKSFYATPRISKNLSENQEFDPAAVLRLKDVLKEFISISNDYRAELILTGATQAFRKAVNADQIVEEIKAELGLELRILSGFQEGLFTFKGATTIIDNFSGYMIDIGGGSTEIILSEKGDIAYSHSFNFGAVSLCELFHMVPPIGKENILEVKKHVSKIIQDSSPIPLKKYRAIAVAGTPTTLACMQMGMRDFDENKIESFDLTRQNILSLIQKMGFMNPAGILSSYGSIVKGREDVILTGAVILVTLMGILDLDSMTVSTRGLRHGLVYDYLNNLV